MNSLDSITVLPDGALTSPAARRNGEAILRMLRAHLPTRGSVLEIASGSGEHAAAFAAAMRDLDWTPSDPTDQAHESIAAWSRQLALSNLKPPLALDAGDPTTWPADTFDTLYCANMTHISPWSATEGLMDLAVGACDDPAACWRFMVHTARPRFRWRSRTRPSTPA